MSDQPFEAKAYTIAVLPKDIVIVHIAYDEDEPTQSTFVDAFMRILRSRGYTNPIIVLQPGQRIESLYRATVLELLHE